METTILTVMVALAAIGFGVLGLVWRSLDKRMDRLEEGRDTDRRELMGVRREVAGMLVAQTRQLERMDRLEEGRDTDRRELMGMLVAQTRQLGSIEGHLGLAASAPGEAPQTSEEAAAV